MNKKEEGKVKTHEEILEILKEIESFEKRFIQPEIIQETQKEHTVVGEKTENIGEPIPEHEMDVERAIEPEITQTGHDMEETIEPEVKKRRSLFSIRIRRRKKPEKPEIKTKHKHNFLLRTKKEILKKLYITDEKTLEAETTEEVAEVKPRSTFTLRINDQGDLAGFNIKKPKPIKEKKHRKLLPFRKGATEESEAEETTEESGIKGKIKGIFSRVKPKKSGEESGSKISNIVGKLKGVIPRRSKK